jgi:Domain of unknown function (DUF3291)
MTLWKTFEDLKQFVFNHTHSDVMRDRGQWFDTPPKQISVMWWVKIGDEPNITQAIDKIALINEIGPSPLAFNFTNHFDWHTNHN